MKHRAVFLAAWVLAGTALLVRPGAWGAVESAPQDELRAKSRAILEKPTVAARRALQQYARQNGESPTGARLCGLPGKTVRASSRAVPGRTDSRKSSPRLCRILPGLERPGSQGP